MISLPMMIYDEDCMVTLCVSYKPNDLLIFCFYFSWLCMIIMGVFGFFVLDFVVVGGGGGVFCTLVFNDHVSNYHLHTVSN